MLVRNNTERFYVPFTQLPPMAMSCNTMVQYDDERVDVDTVKTENISITTRIPPVIPPHQKRERALCLCRCR